ncbi:hypothetical protein [Pseudomonas putida]|uniref:hypothetical protein n=1 Tax=Pseudomonas putida TaxID=303 RepID=UPI0024E0D7A9|nr:hypothetical protein [Pseudomonas putida]HDS0972972.1 hypothetical protein [Pseudomonas putida]
MGDGEFPDFDGGEVIASGKHNAADLTPLSKAAKPLIMHHHASPITRPILLYKRNCMAMQILSF